MFSIPVLPIEQVAKYWRCENCFNSYRPGELGEPSQSFVVKLLIIYILKGYNQHHHRAVAAEICLKLTGFDLLEDEYQRLLQELSSGSIDIVKRVSRYASYINGVGKQQIIEAAFLTTYCCCDMQYEDRLRVNLIGNALGTSLEFVEYAIGQTRKQNYYGVHHVTNAEREV